MKLAPPITAVTLDVGGTLLHPWPSVGAAYARVAARHGLVVPAAELDRAFAVAWRQMGEFHHTRAEWAALVDRTFAGFAPTPPSQSFFPELYDEFREPRAWRLAEDALATLDALAGRGLDLGVISNWDERLVPLLERLDLHRYFEVVVVSCNVGFPKPSPVIFGEAARRFGRPPEHILHVGDCRDRDYAGARAAGFQALHLQRSARPGAPETITALHEIEARLP